MQSCRFCRFLNVGTGLSAVLCAISYGMALAVYQPITVSGSSAHHGLYTRFHAQHRSYSACGRCPMHHASISRISALQNAEGLLDQALRVFGLLGAVLVAVVEIELEAIISLVRITEYWSGRAIVQVTLITQGSSCSDENECNADRAI
jgi:hypothetical protein